MKQIILIITISALNLFAQHLPLHIGNQWHYDQGLGPVIPNAAFAVDTLRINDIQYYKIEYREAYSGTLLYVTYDRMEGDSLYLRYNNGSDELLFNFGWQDGQVIATPWSEDTTCFLIRIMHRSPSSVFGVQTDYYSPETGIYCPSVSEDTSWALSGYTYVQYFGSLDTQDGLLIGAVIDGITYGTLHPLPVELISFSASAGEGRVNLRWETVTESNNRGFEVERLQNYRIAKLQDWETIGFVEGNGTTMDRHTYRFTDNDVNPGNYLYRLKQIDYNGSFEYSNEVEVNINAPLKFSLGQNYPNPFNPVTTINYQLAVDGIVTLKVYNSLGEQVVTLVNEEKPAGAHKVEFDGSDLPSGLYIYRLTAGRNTAARKLVLIK